MSSVISEVELQELGLMDDTTSFGNTFGPMALPIVFLLWPIIFSLFLGVALNAWFSLNPPLIAGWSPGWLGAPFWYFLEINYSFKHYKIAAKSKWLTFRYWKGQRHFENDFKVDHWELLGRSVKMEKMPDGKLSRMPMVRMADTSAGRVPAQNGAVKAAAETEAEKQQKVKEIIEGLETGKFGFIRKPHLWVKKPDVKCDKIHTASRTLLELDPEKMCTDLSHVVDIAGDYIYALYFKSKKFPVAIVCVPDDPDRMISYDGNIGVVVQGGLMFEVEHIAAVSFVRCDHTKTVDIPFLPIGVFTDYSQLAEEVALERAITYVGKEAIQVAALARDTHYSDLYLRQLEDTKALVENLNSQSLDLNKMADDRAAALSESSDKIRRGITRPQIPRSSSTSRGWVKWALGIGIIVGLILFLRFA